MSESNLKNYRFSWEPMKILAEGQSILDTYFHSGDLEDQEDVQDFFDGYGFNINDPIDYGEVFGSYQEAIHFIQKKFLDNEEVEIPEWFFRLTDIRTLFFKATDKNSENKEYSLWATAILKVMHIILHADKDIRQPYFSIIQRQIFDRFYKYIHREGDHLYLKSGDEQFEIESFDIKSRKTRDSTIIKLLHKKESIAEEVFDRIGVRFIAKNKFDVLRILNFLYQNHIVMIHNTKPSRAHNSLFDLSRIREIYEETSKELRDELTKKEFEEKIEERIWEECLKQTSESSNKYSLQDYRSIHFTCRQLIHYDNPFLLQYNKFKESVADRDDELVKKLFSLNTSSIARKMRFFYPFEVQITDAKSHKVNSEGEASHEKYKNQQKQAAKKRLLKDILNFYN